MRSYSISVTEQDVYGFEDVPIPESYEYVDFRIPIENEYFLNRYAPEIVLVYENNCIEDLPMGRIIVKPKE